MERVTITLHQFVTVLAVFLILTTLILSSLAISGHIDFRDDSIGVEAIITPEGQHIALVKDPGLAATGFAAVSDDAEVSGLAGKFSLPSKVSMADLETIAGSSTESIDASSHFAVGEKGLGFVNSGKGFVTLKPPPGITQVQGFSLTLPPNNGTPDQVLATDGNGVLSFVGPTINADVPANRLITAAGNVANLLSNVNINVTSGATLAMQGVSSTLTTTGGNLSLQSSTDIILKANGEDIFLQGPTGTQFGSLTKSAGVDDLVIKSGTTTAITFDGPNATLESATTSQPVFTIKNTTNDTNGSIMKFVKDKGAAGADGDDIGSIEFIGDNLAQEQTSFGKILCQVSEADNTDEAGKMSFFVAASDSTTSTLVAGLVLEGEHATGGEVDVTIGAGVGSTTSVVGLLTVAGASHFTGQLNTGAISTTGTITQGTGQVTFNGNVDARAGLDVTGALTVSTTSTLIGDITLNGAGATSNIIINNTATDGDPQLSFALSGTNTFTMGIDDGDSDKFKIGTTAIGTDTRMTIDGSGNIGIGNTAPGALLEVTNTAANSLATRPAIEISSFSDANDDATSAGVLKFQKSANDTLNTIAATATGEVLGRIEAYGADTVPGETLSSYIEFSGDAAPDTDSVPGKIIFATSDADDAGIPTVRMTIDDGGVVTIPGHLSYTGTKADVGTDILNNTDALAMPWSNSGKTFKCQCTGSAAKVITFAAATAADIGKKITVIQTATPGSATGDITFVLTTQTLDTGSYILKGVGGTFVAPTIEFATAAETTLTLSPAPTNCEYSIGTIMIWEVLSTTEIRCEVRAIALGNGGTGTISFN